ncbi:hypothetical protein BLOT_008245 [Blomia tropicalis]|nr:hypothetical protein BLOT_008245 [Blomia tropicalis]
MWPFLTLLLFFYTFCMIKCDVHFCERILRNQYKQLKFQGFRVVNNETLIFMESGNIYKGTYHNKLNRLTQYPILLPKLDFLDNEFAPKQTWQWLTILMNNRYERKCNIREKETLYKVILKSDWFHSIDSDILVMEFNHKKEYMWTQFSYDINFTYFNIDEWSNVRHRLITDQHETSQLKHNYLFNGYVFYKENDIVCLTDACSLSDNDCHIPITNDVKSKYIENIFQKKPIPKQDVRMGIVKKPFILQQDSSSTLSLIEKPINLNLIDRSKQLLQNLPVGYMNHDHMIIINVDDGFVWKWKYHAESMAVVIVVLIAIFTIQCLCRWCCRHRYHHGRRNLSHCTISSVYSNSSKSEKMKSNKGKCSIKKRLMKPNSFPTYNRRLDSPKSVSSEYKSRKTIHAPPLPRFREQQKFNKKKIPSTLTTAKVANHSDSPSDTSSAVLVSPFMDDPTPMNIKLKLINQPMKKKTFQPNPFIMKKYQSAPQPKLPQMKISVIDELAQSSIEFGQCVAKVKRPKTKKHKCPMEQFSPQ